MKFGNYLAESELPGWEEHYISYEALKAQLKAADFGPSHEQLFIDTLDYEIEKVHAFKRTTYKDLQMRTVACRRNLNDALAGPTPAVSSPLLEDFEGEIYKIAAQVKQLYAFLRINHTAVLKILKKHDKLSGYTIREEFLLHIEDEGYTRDDFDPLLYALSELWDEFRTRGSRDKVEAPQGGGNFVRKTRKYWVHAGESFGLNIMCTATQTTLTQPRDRRPCTDNVTAVKLHIMANLPVLLFKGDTEPDPAITSIYFDNDSFDLYHGRMEKQEGAEALRLRFYGKTDNPQIFVERKTHHEALSGLESVKERFPIHESNVNAFLRGEYSTDEIFAKMRRDGKVAEAEIVSQEKLAHEVQVAAIDRRLRPAVRTFYNRTAFQLPGDSRVRMSLDTQLCMIREDNGGGVVRSGNNWRRTDVGTVFPFNYLANADVIEFPYAVLEVKLESHNGVETPPWVKTLIEGHLVENPPKFSKFGHGIASFFPDQVNILPSWLGLVDMDIRKPSPVRKPTLTLRRHLTNARGQFSTPLPDWDPVLSSKKKRSGSPTGLKISASTTDLWMGNPPPAPPAGHPLPVRSASMWSRNGGDVELELRSASNAIHQDLKIGTPVTDPPAYNSPSRSLRTARPTPSPAGWFRTLLHGDKQQQEPDAEYPPFDIDDMERGGIEPDSIEEEVYRQNTVHDMDQDSDNGKTGKKGKKGGKKDRKRAAARALALAASGQATTSSQASLLHPDDTVYTDPTQPTDVEATPGKPKKVRRIDPKLYIQNERTFIQWCKLGVITGALAGGLFSFSSPSNPHLRIYGTAMTFAAAGIVMYSFGLYLWRLRRINMRMDGVAFSWGPLFVSIILVALLIMSAVLQLTFGSTYHS
ncbi:vacuolar transporter chaperone [Thoreauomyces humboldtii]|nr:vacuolar transporter chaperone [Thoreauomyces humboldtii]